jgi:hypothetical protein
MTDSNFRNARPQVLFYRSDRDASPAGHDLCTKARVAEGLAGLLGGEFGGELDEQHLPRGRLYIVPSETLTDLRHAQRLGLHNVDDLFGGVVPFPFVASKVISHPLPDRHSPAPAGWSARFTEQVQDAVLPGYSVFSAADALLAGGRLLEQGAVRLKDPGGVGGAGQWVVGNGTKLESRLKEIGTDALWRRGLVLERNLRQVVTHSVGQVQVGEFLAAYHGLQSTTRNHCGAEVYGGSEIVVTRGGFDSLMRMQLSSAVRQAVEQAMAYHRAALSSFGGMFVSRCNYDIAQGIDDSGARWSGVLEQSWRIGGASGAEVAALRAFADDPSLQVVRARTCERYGGNTPVPAGAWVLYDGVDDRVGHITKYALASGHDDA